MTITATIFGVLIVLLGLWGIAQPRPLLAWADKVWHLPNSIYFAIALRLLFGIALILAASESRFPLFLNVLGILIVVAALLIPVIGMQRIQALIDWWIARPLPFIRIWAAAAAVFGGVIVYALV